VYSSRVKQKTKDHAGLKRKNKMKTQIADIEITLAGIAMIYGITARGINWLKSNLAFEPWQQQGGGIACEPNMAAAVREGAENDGLTVA
jgi:hypothetical protein